MLFSFILVAVVLLLYYFIANNKNEFAETDVPHMKRFPILGTMYLNLFKRMPLAKISQKIYNLFPNALYCGFYEFSMKKIMIRDAELLKLIMVKDFDHFVDRQQISSEGVNSIFTKSILFLTGTEWKEMRALLSPSFTPLKMRSMFEMVNSCANNMIDYFKENHGDLEIRNVFRRYANDSIASTAFGITVNSTKNHNDLFYKMSNQALDLNWKVTLKMMIHMCMPKFANLIKLNLFDKEATSFFQNVVEDTVKQREDTNITRPDMLQLLIQAKNNEENKLALSLTDIGAQAFIFLFGGLDSTSTALSFVTHLLAEHQDVQQRLTDEIETALNKYDNNLSYEKISELKYLDAVINETVRLYPSFPEVDRVCVEDYTLPPAFSSGSPYTIKKDTCIIIPLYAIQHDPRYFKDPEVFDPDRFYDPNSDRAAKNQFAHLPFGSGPRSCIGMKLASLQIKLALIKLLTNFQFEVCDKTCSPVKLTPHFSMNIDGGFWVKVVPKSSNK